MWPQTGIMWQFPHWFVIVLFFMLAMLKYDTIPLHVLQIIYKREGGRGRRDVDAIANFFVFTGNICLMAVKVNM